MGIIRRLTICTVGDVLSAMMLRRGGVDGLRRFYFVFFGGNNYGI